MARESVLVTTARARGEHSVTSYRQGCRCRRCKRAMHRAAKVWWATARLRAGRDPASYVDAVKVRRHVEMLRDAGWSSSAIASAAMVAPSTITRIRKPDTVWCSRIVAGALLAVSP